MHDYRITLRKVGFVLLLVGFIDIALMIYVVSKGGSYSSSLNIFAVIAGIFLIRGSLAAARVVSWFAGFLLTAATGVLLLVVPFVMPIDLWLTEWRLGDHEALLSIGLAILATAVLVWVYRKLRSKEVLDARAAEGHSIGAPRSAFLLGALLAVGGTLLIHTLLHGEDAAKAIEMAQVKTGSGYKYAVTSMRRVNATVRAVVTAYNEREVEMVEIEWTR